MPLFLQIDVQELQSCLSPGLSQERKIFPCSVVSQVQPFAPLTSLLISTLLFLPHSWKAEDMMRKAMAPISVPGRKEWQGRVKSRSTT